jgi:glycosyltransferase involved in cell wall biosynthesis
VERGTVEIAAALQQAGHHAIVVSAGGRLVEELVRVGAEHIELPIGHKHVSTLRYVRRLRDICRAKNVDIVHARSRLPAWIGYRAIKGMAAPERPRWITTVHGPYSVNFYSRIMTSGERVIAISAFIRDYILRNYPNVDRDRIKVISRGVDRRDYVYGYSPDPSWLAKWRSQYAQFENRKLLVLPGRITRWKGQSEFVEMVAELIRRGQPVHGIIAGGAPPRRNDFEQELKQLVATNNIVQHVSFLGNRDDLRDILASAEVAYSMTIEPEAFGRTTIESLSLGTPVIGYDHGGTGEILREVLPLGLITPRDITAAADATCRFLSQPVVVPQIHRFTLAQMQQQTIDVYESLAEQ